MTCDRTAPHGGWVRGVVPAHAAVAPGHFAPHTPTSHPVDGVRSAPKGCEVRTRGGGAAGAGGGRDRGDSGPGPVARSL